jgi:hypothetical protein
MDFYKIKERETKTGIEIYPDFQVLRSKDLMVRGKSFYAVWDEEKNLWSTDEYDVRRLVDEDLERRALEIKEKTGIYPHVKTMGNFSAGSWKQFRTYLSHLSDSSHQLDENLTFANDEVKKSDYVSKKLPYPLVSGDHSAWDELVGTLYNAEERAKIEWAVGAVVSGDSKRIQKFMVFYGEPGTGKGTIINILLKLFDGYYTTFEAKALTGNNNAFSTEAFRNNPLVAIQHDGDLSKIEDNTKLNSIVSHEDMTINEKFKPSYMSRINAFLFMGSNKPVKITDSKSGVIRRLIDIHPTGETIPPKRYQALMTQVDFELGAIAQHCLEVYQTMGKNYYSAYRPIEMMLETDVFFNFVEANFDIFRDQDGTSLTQAWELYKVFCDESALQYKTPRHVFRTELRSYFETFDERKTIDGVSVRSWFGGFKRDLFKAKDLVDEHEFSLVLDSDVSLLDDLLASYPAQYSNPDTGAPAKYWTNTPTIKGVVTEVSDRKVCNTILSDLDTTKEHYVKVPENLIVIDFDLTDENGEKSLERNLEAASTWPATYTEFSKGGSGIHLHYYWDGELDTLARVYSPGIEIKVYSGDAALRRRLSKCNTVPVATINSGLPLREKKVLNAEAVKSEKSLRDLVERNLRKEIHPGTKPSIDFIHKILEDAYSSDLSYDLTTLRPKVMAFANNSSNNALYCIKMVNLMKFKSEDREPVREKETEEPFVFFDCEVYPNLFIVCWMYDDSDIVVRMINPTPQEIEELVKKKLIGFNNRKYDNHILYGRILGYNNQQLYELSQAIINSSPNAMFAEAYNLSYADIYDYTSLKQSLKKYEIMLGLPHMELDIPWDEPVPPEKVKQVEDYCANDVAATKATHHARHEDFVARQILSDLSGLPVNSSTQAHTARIVFGADREPQKQFVYTDLSEMFPGYSYGYNQDKKVFESTYRGEVTGEGGYVYAEPGMYFDVALLDVASMHPTSIENLDLFGPYTKNFSALKAARIAIKHRDFESARGMLGGKLAPYLKNEDQADKLSYALKIVINIVYGLTSAKFENKFRDPRNKDNIVAKRGALFMIDLKHFVQEQGFTVAHIKTDSIKIPNATPDIIEKVMEFGKKYGYEFEHEATYEKLCLVNDAVYIAKTYDTPKKPAYWTAVGAQFQHPYVFKTLFSKEEWTAEDLCETKSTTTALYLDKQDGQPPHFIGKVGRFLPLKEGTGGGKLLRLNKDGSFNAVTGTKDYLWGEANVVLAANEPFDIDMTYYDKLQFEAQETISKYGNFEEFIK